MPTRMRGALRRVPWLTLAIVGVAIVVQATPAAAERLVHDRARVAAGEWWRLLTGSLVHLSRAHLVMDLAAFGVAGALVERRGRARHALLCLAALALVGLAVQLLAPALARYAGLSGVAFAVLGLAALDLVVDGGAARWMGVAALAALVVKLALDFARPLPLLLDTGAVAVPVSHAAGLVAALATGALSRRSRITKPAAPPAQRTGAIA